MQTQDRLSERQKSFLAKHLTESSSNVVLLNIDFTCKIPLFGLELLFAPSGLNAKMLNPPGDSLTVLAGQPFARKDNAPFWLVFSDHHLEIVFISPGALLESQSSRISLVQAGRFGNPFLQSLAERRLNRLPPLGKSQDSIDFFLSSSFWSLFSCDDVIA